MGNKGSSSDQPTHPRPAEKKADSSSNNTNDIDRLVSRKLEELKMDWRDQTRIKDVWLYMAANDVSSFETAISKLKQENGLVFVNEQAAKLFLMTYGHEYLPKEEATRLFLVEF